VFRASGAHEYFTKLLLQVRSHYPELEINGNNHDNDHVHLVLGIPPKYSVSDMVRIIKCNTGKKMKEKFGYIQRLYWGSDGIWSDGYMVSTLGISESTIKKYVERQGKEDSGQTLFG
jgi:putative transposase